MHDSGPTLNLFALVHPKAFGIGAVEKEFTNVPC